MRAVSRLFCSCFLVALGHRFAASIYKKRIWLGFGFWTIGGGLVALLWWPAWFRSWQSAVVPAVGVADMHRERRLADGQADGVAIVC